MRFYVIYQYIDQKCVKSIDESAHNAVSRSNVSRNLLVSAVDRLLLRSVGSTQDEVNFARNSARACLVRGCMATPEIALPARIPCEKHRSHLGRTYHRCLVPSTVARSSGLCSTSWWYAPFLDHSL